jgi:penicillin-binding protein 1A
MLKSPRDYSPTRNPEAAAARASVLLGRQVATAKMSTREAERAVRVRERPGSEALHEVSCQYFRDWVLRNAPHDLRRGGRFRLIVTLDAWRQAEMVYAADQTLRAGQARRASQIAAVDMTKAGAVRAMLGGSDYAETQFNRATQARRSPGSLAKLALYAEACRQGWKAGDDLVDAPLTRDGWPANHDGQYWGRISVAESMIWSRNGAAARLERAVKVENVVGMARRLGLSGDLPVGRGFSLGAFSAQLLDLTAATATIANGGERIVPTGVIGAIGSYGGIASWRQKTAPERVLSPDCAAMLQKMLRSVVRDGTGKAAAFNAPVHGKTGTSNDYRDAWFVGFVNDTVAGIWVGNDGPAPMAGVGGASLPATAFRTYASNVAQAQGRGAPVVARQRVSQR